MALLGNPSKSTFYRWKQIADLSLPQDTLERMSYIFGIYSALQVLLPQAEAADAWVRKPNTAPMFGGRSALERMLSGQVSDLYVVRQIGSRWRTTADAYLGRQHTSSGTFWWSQANLIAERSLASTWRASGRLEYLNDPNNVVVAYQRGFPGFRTAAASLGLAKHLDQGLLRPESRLFYSTKDSYPTRGLGMLASWGTLSYTVWF